MSNIINIGGTSGGSGSSVVPNPQGTATDTLTKLGIEGTIYDFASGGGHNYSTTEQVVGTWIDGSTLYEITLHTTTAVNLNAQTWTQIPWDNEPSNIDRLISAELIGVVPNTYMVIRFGLDSGHIKAAASVGGSFPTGIGQTDGNEYVTIRYTKSTT